MIKALKEVKSIEKDKEIKKQDINTIKLALLISISLILYKILYKFRYLSFNSLNLNFGILYLWNLLQNSI